MFSVFMSSAWDNMGSQKVHRPGSQKVHRIRKGGS